MLVATRRFLFGLWQGGQAGTPKKLDFGQTESAVEPSSADAFRHEVQTSREISIQLHCAYLLATRIEVVLQIVIGLVQPPAWTLIS